MFRFPSASIKEKNSILCTKKLTNGTVHHKLRLCQHTAYFLLYYHITDSWITLGVEEVHELSDGDCSLVLPGHLPPLPPVGGGQPRLLLEAVRHKLVVGAHLHSDALGLKQINRIFK